MSVEINRAPGASILAKKFPRIARYLEVRPDGWIESRDHWWEWNKDALSPAEQAAGFDEWADFYAWHLAQRADELACDRVLRRIVERWTDSMIYLSRRRAAYARGEDTGEWVPSWVRRPDLATEQHADEDEISDLSDRPLVVWAA